jgi:hypothetical protein
VMSSTVAQLVLRLLPGFQFSQRREIPVAARTSQTWLRWFNSAFASRLGCKHCSDAAVS